LGLGPIAGSFVLLLTTTGRKTGRPRTTPLVYEKTGDEYHVASARGPMADWYRNIQSDPRVEVRVGRRRFRGIGEAVADPARIADYLERQMARSPRLFGAILRAEGIPSGGRRENMMRLAEKRPMVVIRPSSEA
jgi:deazaflavin-dependent oxidoreductase (nitroreductase family)